MLGIAERSLAFVPAGFLVVSQKVKNGAPSCAKTLVSRQNK